MLGMLKGNKAKPKISGLYICLYMSCPISFVYLLLSQLVVNNNISSVEEREKSL